MIICAAKIRWKELSAALTLAAALVLCLWGGQTGTHAPATPVAAVTASSTADPLDYLTDPGWKTEPEPIVDYVALPEDFGAEYADYLAIQKKGGFDLAAYAGETVTRYSYTVTNYPTGEAGIFADVLVLDGKIVGGDLRSPKLDGFLRALTAREGLM